jgi:hypothetical protein
MFGIYYALSAVAVMTTFGFDLPPHRASTCTSSSA